MEHDKYCLYYGTQLDRTNCVDCKRIDDIRKDERGSELDLKNVHTRVEANTRNQIYTDVDNFYEYWADEMSSDARDWIKDILDIIFGIPYDYLKEEE